MVPSTSLPVAESGQRSLDKKSLGSQSTGSNRRAGKDRKGKQEMPGIADRKCLEQQTGSAWNSRQAVPGMARLGRRRELSLYIPCWIFVL